MLVMKIVSKKESIVIHELVTAAICDVTFTGIFSLLWLFACEGCVAEVVETWIDSSVDH
jgi:hypothetical protein